MEDQSDKRGHVWTKNNVIVKRFYICVIGLEVTRLYDLLKRKPLIFLSQL